ncbi:MAG: hydrogenase expression/formation protein HypE [gamma proteobacterium endosymbiont of Lamellibrachia anaximandri]|nr:hydrogenase expression/formation protein HypE [gamma proteobacterium endosymbiont of Lamellibrachia anaximandri]MBL3535034.1 hydrogenase expression/formation protein HypE [gamma proteobacterium endosymbiont of Lamellibrachia anaximandri]
MKRRDKFPLEYGDGSAGTNEFLTNEILTRFKHPSLRELEDSSHLSLGGIRFAITTDTFIVDPPEFPGGDIGRMAVCGTVNDLVAGGARPQALTPGLVVEEGYSMDALCRILDSIASAVEQAKVNIIAGDTKVLNKVNSIGVCINTSGIGEVIDPQRSFRLSDATSTSSIIVTGTVGDHGLSVLSKREGLGFENVISSDCAPLNDLIIPLITNFSGILSLRDPTRGGLREALHSLATASALDVLIETSNIPIKPEVNFGCEMLGLDPIDLVNEGKMLLVVESNQESRILSALREHPLGKDSMTIGHLHPTQSSPSVLLIDNNGNKRHSMQLKGPPIPRLC